MRFIGLVVVVAGSFFLGYMTAKQSIPDVTHVINALSREALDTAIGMNLDRSGEGRQALVQAKAQVTQARSELLERNYGLAVQELNGALDSIRLAGRMGRDSQQARALRALSRKALEAKVALAAGKPGVRVKLDRLQQQIDRVMAEYPPAAS